MSWENVTTPKDAGGLGLRTTHHMNVAILMNQAWRLQQNPNMLWAQVLEAKYFLTTNLFDSICNPQCLHIWTALYEGMQWPQSGMKWIVGDGQTINVWQDNWLFGDTLRCRISRPLSLSEEQCLVTSLCNNHN